MKAILLLVIVSSVSCITTKITETKPDGSTKVTETTVADPALVGQAIHGGLTAAEIIASKKQQEVVIHSTK